MVERSSKGLFFKVQYAVLEIRFLLIFLNFLLYEIKSCKFPSSFQFSIKLKSVIPQFVTVRTKLDLSLQGDFGRSILSRLSKSETLKVFSLGS